MASAHPKRGLGFRPVSGGLALALALLLAALFWSGCAHYEPKALDVDQTAAALEHRSLADAGLQAFLELNGNTNGWPREAWDLDALTLAAFYFSPELEVARTQWGAAKAGESTAGQRPNPTVGISPQYNSTMGVPSPWVAAFNFDVPIETAGKRQLRIAQAERLSEAARLRLGVVAWGIRSKVRSALLDLEEARQRIEVLSQLVAARQKALAAWESKYALGAATANDLAPARLALARAQTELAAAQAAIGEARGRLSAAIAVPLDGLPPAAALRADFATDSALNSREARRRALTSRHDLLAALADYAACEAALKLEIARQYPDLHLNPGYEYDQGDNKWALGLSLELPLLNRNEGPIAEATAKRREAGARVMALQATIIAEVDRAAVAQQAAALKLNALAPLRAEQEKELQRLNAQLEAGAAETIEVLQAAADFAALELSAQEARAQQRRAWSALEDAIQRPLNQTPIEITPALRP
jgi:outer membrane protein TolC